MAIQDCKECGGKVSSKADACPHCGAKAKQQASAAGCCGLLVIAGIVGAAISGGEGSSTGSSSSRASSTSTQDVRPPHKPTREERINSQFHFWDGSHINLERLVKDAMNDPDSYEHVKTTYVEKGDQLVVRLVYRGANAFGGVVRESVSATVDLDGNILSVDAQ